MDFKNISDLLIKNHGDTITIDQEKNVIFVSYENWLEVAKI